MTAKEMRAKPVPVFFPWIALLFVLLVSVWLRVQYLWVNGFSYDEGLWLMFGKLANAGYPPYSETFVGITPLAVLTIQLGARLFGTTTLAVRYPMMLFSLLGVVAIFLSFRPWRSVAALLTGTLAAVFLSFAPEYFTASASIMGEVPATSLAVVCFVFVQQYTFDRKWRWLALSGAAFSLSLAFKLLVVFMPAMVALMVLTSLLVDKGKTSRSEIFQQLVIGGVVWLSGAIVPWLIFIMIYDPYAMFEQTFLFRLSFRQVGVAGGFLPGNTDDVSRMLVNRMPLLVGAVVGVVAGRRKQRVSVWYWGIWFGLSLLPLLWQSPMRQRYAVMMDPALAALSAIGVVELSLWGVQNVISNPGIRQPAVAIISLAAIAGVLGVTAQKAFSAPALDTFPDLNIPAVQYVWQNTAEGDCLITDDQRFALAANRLVPPRLSETTAGRLAAGWLTTDVVLQQMDLYDCPLAIYADWRFAQYLPDLESKLHELFFLELPFEENMVVYAAEKHVTQLPSTVVKQQLGDKVIVEGVDLTPGPWIPGQEVRLATYWTTLQPLERPYKIFLQLRDDRDEPVANFDHFPFPAPAGDIRPIPHVDNIQHYSAWDIHIYPKKGMLPTNAWPPGQTIREVISMQLPADFSPGSYNLFIGMYDPDTDVRLPAKTESGEGDEILAAQIDVVEGR